MSPDWISSLADIFISFLSGDKIVNTPRHRFSAREWSFTLLSSRFNQKAVDYNCDEKFSSAKLTPVASYFCVAVFYVGIYFYGDFKFYWYTCNSETCLLVHVDEPLGALSFTPENHAESIRHVFHNLSYIYCLFFFEERHNSTWAGHWCDDPIYFNTTTTGCCF